MINLADYKDAIIARFRKMSPKELQNRLQAKGYDVIVTNKHMKNKKTPTNTESLIRLKEQNFQIRIHHLRKVKTLAVNEDGLFCYKVDKELHNDSFIRRVNQEANVEKGEIPYFKYIEHGGATILYLKKGDEEITVQSTCYAKDRFDRREGVAQALKRLKKLHGIEV